MTVQLLSAFFLTVAFGVLYNVAPRSLVWCGVSGTVGWLVYLVLAGVWGTVGSTFFASVAVALSAMLIHHFKGKPVTIFLVPGIFPLIPGGHFYSAVYYFMIGEKTQGFEELAAAGKISLAIVLGLMLVVTFPASMSRKGNSSGNYR